MTKLNFRFETLTIIFAALTFFSFSALGNSFNESRDALTTEVLISTDDVNIGGTLLVPKQLQSTALVVFISGSSWQDRDNTIYGFPMFKIIAEHLAKEGIASFRYDDRGVGTSTGDFVNSTMADLTKDVHDITRHFSTFEEKQFNDFILFGHSQGGIVATRVATENDKIKGLVLAGSPGVTIAELVLTQSRNELANDANSVEKLEKFVSSNNRLLYATANQRSSEKVEKQFKEHYAPILKNSLKNEPLSEQEFEDRLSNDVKTYVTNYGLPALTSFLYVNPTVDLSATKVPVLSLHGGLDNQVKLDPNKDRIEIALLTSNAPFQTIVFGNADHFFKAAKDSQPVDGFLESISSWVLNMKEHHGSYQ